MDALRENLDITAMVLGYPVMVVIFVLILWFGARAFRDITKIFSEMRYERRARRIAERHESNYEAEWALDLDSEIDEVEDYANVNTHDTDVLPHIPWQRHQTAELPQLYNYQEDLK